MVEVVLEGMPPKIEEATIQRWFFEEGDSVNAGEDILELVTAGEAVVVQSPVTGVLCEVYFDEGEVAQKGEVLCQIDDEDGEVDFVEDDEEDSE